MKRIKENRPKDSRIKSNSIKNPQENNSQINNSQINRIRLVEREMNRIEKVCRMTNHNPIDILNLQLPFTVQDIVGHYRQIVRLIHPDKNNNIDRFKQVFVVVNDSYKFLLEPNKKSICIRSKKLKKSDMLKELYKCDFLQKKTKPKKAKIQEENTDRRMVLWDPSILSTQIFQDKIKDNKVKVNVDIAMDGAAHTKNKCKSKLGKHQKGLRQRKIQQRNANRRYKKHGFTFSNKISINIQDK